MYVCGCVCARACLRVPVCLRLHEPECLSTRAGVCVYLCVLCVISYLHLFY